MNWRNLAHLAGHHTLRVLRLGTPELRDITALRGLNDLMDLDLSGCHSLKDEDLVHSSTCRPR